MYFPVEQNIDTTTCRHHGVNDSKYGRGIVRMCNNNGYTFQLRHQFSQN